MSAPGYSWLQEHLAKAQADATAVRQPGTPATAPLWAQLAPVAEGVYRAATDPFAAAGIKGPSDFAPAPQGIFANPSTQMGMVPAYIGGPEGAGVQQNVTLPEALSSATSRGGAPFPPGSGVAKAQQYLGLGPQSLRGTGLPDAARLNALSVDDLALLSEDLSAGASLDARGAGHLAHAHEDALGAFVDFLQEQQGNFKGGLREQLREFENTADVTRAQMKRIREVVQDHFTGIK